MPTLSQQDLDTIMEMESAESFPIQNSELSTGQVLAQPTEKRPSEMHTNNQTGSKQQQPGTQKRREVPSTARETSQKDDDQTDQSTALSGHSNVRQVD